MLCIMLYSKSSPRLSSHSPSPSRHRMGSRPTSNCSGRYSTFCTMPVQLTPCSGGVVCPAGRQSVLEESQEGQPGCHGNSVHIEAKEHNENLFLFSLNTRESKCGAYAGQDAGDKTACKDVSLGCTVGSIVTASRWDLNTKRKHVIGAEVKSVMRVQIGESYTRNHYRIDNPRSFSNN